MLANIRLASVLLAVNFYVSSVSAHGKLVSCTGTNGKTSIGFGIVAGTSGTSEADVPVINAAAIKAGKTGICGKTAAGGNIVVATQLAAAVTAGVATAAADGSVAMTLHQVNGDGAGPYKCQISADGTGDDFVDAVVTTNVPGTNGDSKTRNTDFPLVAKLPAGTTCTGGPDGKTCLMRCTNPARAGAFGGCVAIATSGSTTAAGPAGCAAAGAASSSSATAVVSASASTTATDSAAATTTASMKGAKGAKDAKAARDGAATSIKKALISRIVGAGRSGKWI